MCSIQAPYEFVVERVEGEQLQELVMMDQARQEMAKGIIFHGLVGTDTRTHTHNSVLPGRDIASLQCFQGTSSLQCAHACMPLAVSL